MATAVKPQRPRGVTVLGGLVLLAGLIVLVLAIVNLLVFFGALVVEPAPALEDELLFAILVGLAVGIALLASGAGLLRLRPWAWWLALLVAIVAVIRGLFAFLAGLTEALTVLLSTSVGLILGVVILGYVVSVKRHFR